MSKKKTLTKEQKEYIADKIALFFLDYWKKQEARDNQVAVLKSGSLLEEASPDTKTAT